MKTDIEIPFGAKDSELKGWEYTIPEGMEAVVKDGKVIVREKENEDERIRKALICGLSEGLSEHNWQGFGGATIDECLAWLEKQKEKVSDEFDENYKIGDYHSGLILAWVNQPSTLQPAHKYHGKNVVAIHLKKGGFRCCCVDDPSPITFEIPDGTLSPLCGKWHNEKSVEKKQQPAEYLDKDKVYTIMNKLHDLAFSHLIPINSNEYKKIGEITGDVRRLLDYPIEQKPAEWSVEKEKAVEDYANEIIKWEDAHPDWNMEVIRATAYHFFNFQPKQEWSEEDEKMMRNVYESLYAYQCDIRAGIMDKNSRELLDDVEKEKQWLKSLRPQRH